MKAETHPLPASSRGQVRPPRASLGLTFAVSCFLLALLAGCDREDLVQVSSEKEANLILAELALRGMFDVTKVAATQQQRKSAWTISVPATDAIKARETLVSLNLPHTPQPGFDEMLANAPLMPSAADERARLTRATCGELSRTLETYEGVLEARVHVFLQEKDPMRRPAATQPSSTATVLIKRLPATAAGGNQVPREADVQRLVARSLEGVRENAVEVQFTTATPRTLPPIPPRPIYKDPVFQAFVAASVLGLAAGVAFFFFVRAQRTVTALRQKYEPKKPETKTAEDDE